MSMKNFAAILTVAAVGLGGISTGSADHGRLSGDQIKTLLGGAKGRGENFNGGDYVIRYGADGSLKFDDVESGASDTGKWTIEGDEYCSQWNRRNAGKKNCSTLRHTSGRKYLFVNSHDDRQIKVSISK